MNHSEPIERKFNLVLSEGVKINLFYLARKRRVFFRIFKDL